MKYFLIIFYSILSAFLADPIKPKLCINCKFFKNNFIVGSAFGKCSLFPIFENNDSFLVNGINQIKKIDYKYCSILRENDNYCGRDGKLYKEKKIKLCFFDKKNDL